MTVTAVYANELVFDVDGQTVQCQVTGWQLDRSVLKPTLLRTACPDGVVSVPDPNAEGVGTLTVDGLADWTDAGWSMVLANSERDTIPFTLNVDTDDPLNARTWTGEIIVPYQQLEWGPVGELQKVTYEFTLTSITGPTRYTGP